MTAYYNEIDPYAAQWLRNLIAAGHIAPGDVDERSIKDVKADDLKGYIQAHFFAGIGGWSYALKLAGWPDDRPVWTGSCPCQPFSAAGAGKAGNDERHLWPAWFPLIQECQPAIVFGEQVEAAVGWGWLDLVFADLEGQGYACGATVLPACGIGAPHIRQRLWFVADAVRGRADDAPRQSVGTQATSDEENGSLLGQRLRPRIQSAVGELADATEQQRDRDRDAGRRGREPSNNSWMDDTDEPRSQGRRIDRNGADELLAGPASMDGCVVNATGEQVGISGRTRKPGETFWSHLDWLPCTDGKARPVEPGSFPLAHGVQRRASKLRAYGNAIVPQVAARFIEASVMDSF